MGGDDIAPEEEQQGTQAEPLEEGVDKNLGKNIDNRVALPSEGEIGAALNAVTIEPEDGRARQLRNILNRSLLNPHLSGKEEP